MRKLIIILSGVIVVSVIALLFVINILFFREMAPLAPSVEAPVLEEPEMAIAIPSTTIPAAEQIIDVTQRRKELEERKLEAERARAINRAAALAQMKALEKSPPPSSLPEKAEALPPSAEELSELEKKGIISY